MGAPMLHNITTYLLHMRRSISRQNTWRATPAFVKKTIGSLLVQVPPAWWLGKQFRGQSAHVSDAQWWSAGRSRACQLERLKEIIKLAYDRTAFYRHLLDDAGVSPCDLRSLETMRYLPTIDKSAVVDNLSNMRAGNRGVSNADYMSTGGTSGVPLHFYINANRSSVEYAYLTTSWERVGYKLGMPMAVLRGRTVSRNQNGLRHEYDPILRHHHYSSFHMSDENMGRYVEHISTIGPCFLHVYPSTVAALARFLRRTGQQAPANIQGIIAESEIVYPEQREMVEAVFGCRYFSCYGHTEKLILAAECEHSSNYHVWPTYGYFELLDEEGNPVCTPGQRGEIVGTGFINTVMPFIRYRTGDWATYVGDRCEACGREQTIIRDIRGHRTQEMLVAVDGSEISWTALNMHDDTFVRVRQFQFVQKTLGQAVLRVVPGQGFSDADARRIQHNLGQKLNGRLTFTIESVEAIPVTTGGKAIYVDQRIPREHLSNEATETP
jgi:phenylacetate-coenzyme A ligase PaaK-like adenylate-forming protein